MLILLSPAKSLDFDAPVVTKKVSQPVFTDRAGELIERLRKKRKGDIRKLMRLSDSLAELNMERYQAWRPDADLDVARPAAWAFNGDVYLGLDAHAWQGRDRRWAQDHLRILSGLYGVLRPLDLIQPYRLEMGTRLANPAGKDLYAFWRDAVTRQLNEDLHRRRPSVVVNLASNEYFKAVDPAALNAPVITPTFQEKKNGQYKFIQFYGKRARGMMASWIVRNRPKTIEEIQGFDDAGYQFNPGLSGETDWVFTRKAPPAKTAPKRKLSRV